MQGTVDHANRAVNTAIHERNQNFQNKFECSHTKIDGRSAIGGVYVNASNQQLVCQNCLQTWASIDQLPSGTIPDLYTLGKGVHSAQEPSMKKHHEILLKSLKDFPTKVANEIYQRLIQSPDMIDAWYRKDQTEAVREKIQNAILDSKELADITPEELGKRFTFTIVDTTPGKYTVVASLNSV